MAAVDAYGGWSALLGLVTAGNDLDRGQAAAAMSDILSDEATHAQIAGLIVGLRMKGESVEEMTGLVTAMQDAAQHLVADRTAVDIVGTGGSSHRRTHALNISTMACIVASAAGAIICKHGNRRASSTSGSSDFLEALGIAFDLDGPTLERYIAETGAGFAFARGFHPSMRFAGPVRVELGIPTVFNVLGPLANPGHVTRQVIGVATEELAAKMAQVRQNLGTDKAWVVTGDMGLDELAVTGRSVVFEVDGEGIRRFEIDPSDLGLRSGVSLDELAGGDAEANAEIFRAIITGVERGPRRDVVVLNAAAGLVVGGVTDDLATGLSLASNAIDDGRVATKLDQLIAVSKRLAAEG